MQTSNPAISVISNNAGAYNFGGTEAGATIQGTTTKSILLVALTLVVGYFMMAKTINDIFATGQISYTIVTVSAIVAFVIALVTTFKPNISMFTAPAYAIAEGAALGSISGVFELQFPGIVSTAVLSTFVVVMTMLVLWKLRIVVPTAKFRSVITGAIMAIAIVYLADMAFHLFGSALLPQTGPIAILISVVVCAVAAFSLILDFDAIEQGVNQGLPKYFEYYNAFSLLVTICWLYIEILKLLARLQNRD